MISIAPVRIIAPLLLWVACASQRGAAPTPDPTQPDEHEPVARAQIVAPAASPALAPTPLPASAPSPYCNLGIGPGCDCASLAKLTSQEAGLPREDARVYQTAAQQFAGAVAGGFRLASREVTGAAPVFWYGQVYYQVTVSGTRTEHLALPPQELCDGEVCAPVQFVIKAACPTSDDLHTVVWAEGSGIVDVIVVRGAGAVGGAMGQP